MAVVKVGTNGRRWVPKSSQMVEGGARNIICTREIVEDGKTVSELIRGRTGTYVGPFWFEKSA